MNEYAEVFRSDAAVTKYDEEVYAPGTFASAVDARQRVWLREFVRRAFPGQGVVQQDFACGTGRAIRALEGAVAEAHGYDVSEEMLARARQWNTPAALHLVATDGPVPRPEAAQGRPVLVTMFRLLLNVSDEVRDRAIAFAAAALPTPESGLLVVENHGNSRSLRHLLRWRNRGNPWFTELSPAQVTALLARHGFAVEGVHGFGVLPIAGYRLPLLARWARVLDDWAARRSWLAPVSVDVLYVARRVGAQ
jgi:SAM-dependent methyltransferase